jgi:hypothetical protein
LLDGSIVEKAPLRGGMLPCSMGRLTPFLDSLNRRRECVEAEILDRPKMFDE